MKGGDNMLIEIYTLIVETFSLVKDYAIIPCIQACKENPILSEFLITPILITTLLAILKAIFLHKKVRR